VVVGAGVAAVLVFVYGAEVDAEEGVGEVAGDGGVREVGMYY
jgi:hypothetical protein